MRDESGFLRAIVDHPNDPVHRLVYADWLEEHDDPRAEYLRLDLQLSEMEEKDEARAPLVARLEELRRGLGEGWLAQVDRTPIDRCPPRFAFECPLRWELLLETEDPRTRFCQTCGQDVHFSTTIDEAREHALQGHCVAVCSHVPRTPGDLDPPGSMLVTMGVIDSSWARQQDADALRDQILEAARDQERRAGGSRRRRRRREDLEE